MNNTGRKHGGRAKGTPNKITIEIRDMIREIISNEMDNVPDYISAISKPEIKVKLIIDLLPYVLPKLSEKAEMNQAIEEDLGLFGFSEEDIKKAFLKSIKLE